MTTTEALDRFLEDPDTWHQGKGDASGAGSVMGSMLYPEETNVLGEYGFTFGRGYGHGSGCAAGFSDGVGWGCGVSCGAGMLGGEGGGGKLACGGIGVLSVDGAPLREIDKMPTVLTSVRGSCAKGFILDYDMTRTPVYVARQGQCFAHGRTLAEAVEAARRKEAASAPVDERVDAFVKEFPDPDVPVSGRLLFERHGTLTGSCYAGREAFCRSHGIRPDDVTMDVRTFIALTEDAYGGQIIRKLKSKYREMYEQKQ